MLLKSILATLVGAAVTGGAVYIAQNPEVLEPAPKTVQTQIEALEQTLEMAAIEAESETDFAVEASIGQNHETLDDRLFSEQSKVELAIQPEPSPISELEETLRVERVELPVIAPVQELATETGNANDSEQAASPTFINEIMEQADKIETPDLRDQAYFDLVDYAILRDEFDAAARATDLIFNPALRDTARNRIAIKYALNGDSDAAFAMLDDLENPELTDFIRLQIVQALIVPDRLPEGVVPR